MPFDDVISGTQAIADACQQFVDCFNGVSGGAQPIHLTALSGSTHALNIRQLSGNHAKITKSDDATVTLFEVTDDGVSMDGLFGSADDVWDTPSGQTWVYPYYAGEGYNFTRVGLMDGTHATPTRSEDPILRIFRTINPATTYRGIDGDGDGKVFPNVDIQASISGTVDATNNTYAGGRFNLYNLASSIYSSGLAARHSIYAGIFDSRAITEWPNANGVLVLNYFNRYGGQTMEMDLVNYKGGVLNSFASTATSPLQYEIDGESCSTGLNFLSQAIGTSQVDHLVITGGAGTFTITVDGQITAPIAYGANAATITTALELLSTVDFGDVLITGAGTSLSPYVLTWGHHKEFAALVVSAVGAGGCTATLTASTVASGFYHQVDHLVNTGGSGTFTITVNGETTSALTYGDSAATVKDAIEALTLIGSAGVTGVTTGVSVSGAGTGGSPYILTWDNYRVMTVSATGSGACTSTLTPVTVPAGASWNTAAIMLQASGYRQGFLYGFKPLPNAIADGGYAIDLVGVSGRFTLGGRVVDLLGRTIRLPNLGAMYGRNYANTADLAMIFTDAADRTAILSNAGVALRDAGAGNDYAVFNSNGAQLATYDTSAAIRNILKVYESTTLKYSLGLSATDKFIITNAAGTTATMTLDPETGDLSTVASIIGGTSVTSTTTLTAGTSLHVTTTSQLDGTAYIGDTSNVDITKGLTINQGGADDHILALKSTDVAHGMTTLGETDTYGAFLKGSPTTGGLQIRSLSGASTVSMWLRGVAGVAEGTPWSTGSIGPIILEGALTNGGTGQQSLGVSKNILVVRDTTSARFALDSNGDSHQDVGTAWTNFDTEDDLAVLTSLSHELARPENPVDRAFGQFLAYNRVSLERLGLASFNDGEGQDGHPFVNMSRLTMLLTGAVRQNGLQTLTLQERLNTQEERLFQLESKLLAISAP